MQTFLRAFMAFTGWGVRVRIERGRLADIRVFAGIRCFECAILSALTNGLLLQLDDPLKAATY